MAYGGDLQANTAVDLMVGPFVDEDNGKTAETSLTITQAEVRLSKNGGNMAQKSEATSLTHDELGNYVCKLDTTDTNAEGILTLMIHESGALPIKMDYTVLSQAAYISKYTAKDTGYMDVNIVEINDTATNLDKLIDADTAVAADGNLDAIVVDGSVFAHIMTVDKTTDSYNATESSLQAAGTDNDAIKAETVLIVEDTNAIEGKLPTNKFMGSSDGADDDTTLNTIAEDVVNINGIVPAAVADLGTVQSGDSFAIVNGVAGLVAINSDVEAILGHTGTDGVLVSATAITAIWAKAMSDLAGIPAYNASVLDAINITFMALRNKQTATSSEQTIRNNAGATIATSVLSDAAGTTTKEEYA